MILELLAVIAINEDKTETNKAHTFKNYAKAIAFIWLFGAFLALIGGLLQLLIPEPAHGQTRTYQDSMGRETGRSSTNGNVTTFSNSLGQNTGRAVTNNGTTTIYNERGQQTGAIKEQRR